MFSDAARAKLTRHRKSKASPFVTSHRESRRCTGDVKAHRVADE